MFVNPVCVLCGTPVDAGADGFCRACREDLPPLPSAMCPGCGAQSEYAAVCVRCLAKPPAFDVCIAAYSYHYPVDRMIRKLKYQARLDLARALSGPLIELLEPARRAPPECLLPIPLHRARRRRRGFNQAREIALLLARTLAVPVDEQLVHRHKPTAQQFDLRPEHRARNVKDAFSLVKTMSYKHIAIIDDVLTTGATANELARLLKANGAEQVQVWCLARAIKYPNSAPSGRELR